MATHHKTQFYVILWRVKWGIVYFNFAKRIRFFTFNVVIFNGLVWIYGNGYGMNLNDLLMGGILLDDFVFFCHRFFSPLIKSHDIIFIWNNQFNFIWLYCIYACCIDITIYRVNSWMVLSFDVEYFCPYSQCHFMWENPIWFLI